jgi:hypothetical protein
MCRWMVRTQVQEHEVFISVTTLKTPVFRYKT